MTDTVRTFRIDHDLFFISRAFYDLYKQRLARCLLLPIDEFLAHSSYNTVHSASNHSLWEIACDCVIVAEEGWYEQLEATFQQALFTETTKCGSTLIDGSKPITIRYWKGLSAQQQAAIIRRDDDLPGEFPLDSIGGYAHLKLFHHKFPASHGANCFAAVLYAIHQNPFIINEWVHPKTFLLALETLGYQAVEGCAFGKDDVLCFYDKGQLIHASYAVSHDCCFHKTGQTFWEHWAFVPFCDAQRDFEGTQYRVYRKQ